MKIIFFGSPKSAIPILEKISNSRHQLVAVVTQNAKPKGREKKLTKTDIAQYCIEKKINIFESNNISDLFENELKNLEFDLAVVVAFGQLVPAELLAIPKHGWINLHYSLLPELRGAAPVQWTILNDLKEAGITWFQLDQGLDTGPILLQKKIESNDLDYRKLIHALNELAVMNLDKFLDDIENNKIKKIEQKGDVTYAPKLNEKDLKIDWNSSCNKIILKIKTGNDFLAAWSVFRGDKIKILSFQGLGNESLPPGEIKIQSKTVLVGTESEPLVLGEVIPQGKKRMRALDWLNGVQLKESLKFD